MLFWGLKFHYWIVIPFKLLIFSILGKYFNRIFWKIMNFDDIFFDKGPYIFLTQIKLMSQTGIVIRTFGFYSTVNCFCWMHSQIKPEEFSLPYTLSMIRIAKLLVFLSWSSWTQTLTYILLIMANIFVQILKHIKGLIGVWLDIFIKLFKISTPILYNWQSF